MELKEAKDAQSPEVKLLCSLERKLVNMELRHQSREKELQQVLGSQVLGSQHQFERLRSFRDSKEGTWFDGPN